MQHYLLIVLLFNFITFLPATSVAGTFSNNPYDKLYDDQQEYWYKLLHAKFFSGKSKLDGEKFFLAPDGKKTPSEELYATIKAFKDPNKKAGWFDYPVQCVFRERFAFLKEAGLLEGVPETPCPMFDEWKKGLNVDSVTLVFSSSYPNNPASLFGHTLIRLNQKNKTNDLLDYAVAFSAIPDPNDLSFLYAFKGLTGGYRGLIEITKYYTKVNDYIHSESRDLIEYNLNLTQAQINRLINHIWEIYQTTYADYYFLDENCSSFLADLMAVALHEVDGINDQSRWFYLPSEMIKKMVNTKGLVKSINYRPSIKKQLEKKLANLNEQELKSVKEIVSHNELSNEENDLKVVDSVISVLDYKRYQKKMDLTPAQNALFRKSLIKRSSMPEASVEKFTYEEKNRPELGHETKKWEYLIRTENKYSLLGITFKNGYHNFMGRDLGYDPFSHFEFFSGTMIYNRTLERLNFDEFNIIQLTSLHPYTFYDPQFSWDVGLSVNRFFSDSCELCHQLDAHAEGGLTLKPCSGFIMNLLAGAFLESSKHIKKGFRSGPMLQASLLMSAHDKFKLGLFQEVRMSAVDKIKDDFRNMSTIKMSFFPSKDIDLNFELKGFTRIGSFSKDTHVYQLSYGHYY